METLTFLFTDIEGSTALLGRLGEDLYARVLAAHHAMIRSALAAHDGREMDTQGDAFFAVFSWPVTRATGTGQPGFTAPRKPFRTGRAIRGKNSIRVTAGTAWTKRVRTWVMSNWSAPTPRAWRSTSRKPSTWPSDTAGNSWPDRAA